MESKKSFDQYIKESLAMLNEAKKEAGLSKEETLVVAQKFADAMSKADNAKVTVNKRTLEEDSFDLDVNGEEYDGGSYIIYQNGDVMNAAVPGNPIYGKKNDTVDTIAKNMKKMIGESFVKEGVDMEELQDTLKRVKKENPGKKIGYAFIKDASKGYKISINGEYVNESSDTESLYNVIDKKSGEVMSDEPLKKDLAKKFAAKKTGWIIQVNESLVTEGRVTLKRRYTENHPAVTVGKNATIRNKVLEAIKDGKISQEQFDNIVSELSNDSKRWTKSNSKYFSVSEEGVSLSKFGRKVLNSVTVNEATTKNPEIWVPGGFDKEVSKIPNQKIDVATITKIAKKYDVDIDDAIAYVEYGWDIDLSENTNTNMKTKFIYESFGEFVNSLNESTLNEAFASAKLASILTGANKMDKDLPSAFYSMSKLALDKIQDIDIIEMTPDQAKKEKRASAVYLYFTTNEKENPYAGKSSYNKHTIPSNTLLAITDGSNEWMATEWQRSYTGDKKSIRTLKTTKRDDSAGIDKSGASDQYGSGISSMKQVVDLADRAYCLDLTVLKARYSTLAQKDERSAAKKGATAFMNDKEFKAENKKRYNDILASKAATMPMDSIVLDAIDTLGAQIKDGISKGEKGKYGDLILGLDPRGRELNLSDASNLMRNILDEYARYVGDVANDEKEKLAGYGGNYYSASLNQRAKNITDLVKKIATKSYAW